MTTAAATVPVPSRIRALRRDRQGRPVPWFVDDQPHLRRSYATSTVDKRIAALRRELCWICGQKLPTGQQARKPHQGVPFTFLMPVSCVIDRTAVDPPAHDLCAEYAARSCPALQAPGAPGVVAWSTIAYRIERPPYGGGGRLLLKLGDPRRVVWWRRGRPARRADAAEELAAVAARLQSECRYDPDPVSALAAVQRQFRLAMRFLPPT